MRQKIKLIISLALNVIFLTLEIVFLKMNIERFQESSYHYFTVIANLLGAIFVALFFFFQFFYLFKNKKPPIFSYILYYMGTTSLFFVLLISLIIFYPQIPQVMDNELVVLHVVCPLIMFINFMFFIDDGQLVFLDSLFSLVPVIIYEIVIGSLISSNLITAPYSFIDPNMTKLWIIVIYYFLVIVMDYIFSAIMLMYYPKGQELTSTIIGYKRK